MESDSTDMLPPNGAGAAALLAAAIGASVLGLLALAADAFSPIGHIFNVWNPTGPLSGVTSAAVLAWLLAWGVLSRRWSARDIDLHWVNLLSLVLFVVGLLLTFPPFMDLLQGK